MKGRLAAAARRGIRRLHIDIFSDPICPWCFIGKRRLHRALEARPGVRPTIRWRAFQLNPAMPAGGIERQAYLAAKFGSAIEAERLFGTISRVGAAEGIEFRFDRIAVTPNTVDAHRLIRYADRHETGDGVLDVLFRAFFAEGRDIGDRGVLADVAAEAGLGRAAAAAFLATEEDADAVRGEDMRARQLGIEGVPCFIVDRRYALSGAQEPEAFFSLFDMVTASESRAAAG
jgi:predicted DsbA family dithiol-disulfide isomerase